MIEDLQKALDKFPFQSKECPDQIARYWCEQCQQKQHCDWLKEFKMLLVKVFREKIIAEEKNVEYAKLVAVQAEEYAEKNAAFQRDYVTRKQLSGHVRIVCAANPSFDYCEHCYQTERRQCPTGKILFGEQKELLEGSSEHLNLALAFSDVRMKKKGAGSESK